MMIMKYRKKESYMVLMVETIYYGSKGLRGEK